MNTPTSIDIRLYQQPLNKKQSKGLKLESVLADLDTDFDDEDEDIK